MKLLIILPLLISFVICDCCEGESNPYDDVVNVCVRRYEDTIWIRSYCLESYGYYRIVNETVFDFTYCSSCGDTLGNGLIGAISGGILIIGMIMWFCNCCMIRSTIIGHCKNVHGVDHQPIN